MGGHHCILLACMAMLRLFDILLMNLTVTGEIPMCKEKHLSIMLWNTDILTLEYFLQIMIMAQIHYKVHCKKEILIL